MLKNLAYSTDLSRSHSRLNFTGVAFAIGPTLETFCVTPNCKGSKDLTQKISIVTPSYNQRAFLEVALESVRAQNYPSLEHIVVDGASTDGTVEYLRSLTWKRGWEHLHWISEPDEGQSDALNKGFKMAAGTIVGWLNSDDVYR